MEMAQNSSVMEAANVRLGSRVSRALSFMHYAHVRGCWI